MFSRSVLVVEDYALMRELLAAALTARGFDVDTAASAAEASAVFRDGDHDALVLDLDLGDGPDGFAVAESLLARSPHTAVVFLTNLPDPRFADRDPADLPAGVAYLRKAALEDVETLVVALDRVLRGASTEEFRHDLDPGRPLASLTRKQLAVLRLVAEGLSNLQIAQRRGVTEKAIEDTFGRACAALGLRATPGGNQRVTAARQFLTALGRGSTAD